MPPAFKPLVPLDEALSRLHQTLQDLPRAAASHERVPTEAALGRVLALDLTSSVDVPPHDNSAMDGYALRVADLASASSCLPLAQRVAAGQVGAAIAPGTCSRVFTGAPLPAGADAVVMQEQTQPGEQPGTVRFGAEVAVGQNIRLRGEDIACGQVVLQAGSRLSPASLGVAASVGAAELVVQARPAVGILTTGDELVMPGQPLPPGAIYNSNRHTLIGLTQSVGATHVDLGTVPDQLGATRAALQAAAERCDLVITSGGVSVGEEDHLRQAVSEVGGLDFWALAIKPGKPYVLGWLRRADGSRALYMGLPGNPVASFVTFLLLARPAISWLAGQGWRLPRPVWAEAGFDWPHPDRRREFLRARLGEDGRLALHPHQGSGVLSSAAWADGLIDLPEGTTVRAGDRLRWLPMSELLQPAAAFRQG